jgi:signal transduction histidine kinase/CheY-like chemotaxis protein
MRTSFPIRLFRMVDILIPAAIRNGGDEDLRNARTVYSTLILIMLNDLAFGFLGLAQGDRVLPWIVLGTGFLAAFTPWLHRRSGSLRLSAAWIALLCTALLSSVGLLSGGMHSSTIVWFGALAVFILVTMGSSAAFLWACGMAAASLCLWWFTVNGHTLPDFENPESKVISWALSFPAGLFLIILMLKGFFEAHRQAIRNMERQARVLGEQAAELGRAKAIAETALRSRSEFIATVSHEIRTPMDGILGVADLLRDTPLSSLQRKYLDALGGSAEGLLAIIGDILDFSKIESGKLKISPERFSIRNLCENSLSVFAGIVETKGLRLPSALHPDLSQQAVGDPLRIRQILINLIGNAVKFTDKGSVSLDVRPMPDRIGWVEFTVSDEGIGMDETVLASLFQPYVQGDGSSTRKYGGTGLGLAICDRLVAMMGGEIMVKSVPGAGSTFSVRLPLPNASLPADPKPAESATAVAPVPASSLAPSNAPSISPKRNFHGARVLLAEDNPVNRMVAVRFLDKLGATVDVAVDGKEAVDLWKPGRYAAVFMDCQMPTLDGYNAARAIRALERKAGSGSATPIIALTAHAMEEDRDRCLDAGMDDYLSKPVRLDSLLAALNRWIPMGPENIASEAPHEAPQKVPIAEKAAEVLQKTRPGKSLLMGAGSTRESSK